MISDVMKIPKLTYYDLGEGVVAFSSTRHGGYSTGAYGEFNINRYCGDSDEAISRNREALCQLLGIGDDQLLMPHQTHQTEVIGINQHFLALPPHVRQAALEGKDAIMTDLTGVCIGVSTADCIPLLLYDREHHAACAVHAGWRGTVARITEKAVAAMTAAYGTRPERLVAQIGPGIGLDSFEVGQEVYDAFLHARFDMAPISRREAKWHIDLPECNRRQLLTAGLVADSIAPSPACTFKQPGSYFSARRLGISSGRIFTAILLR